MVATNHHSRPTADQVLSALNCNEKQSEEEHLSKNNCCESQELVTKLRTEIEDLRSQLAEKNAIIEKLSMSK